MVEVGLNGFRDELGTVLPKAAAAAQRDWKRGSTYQGMLQIIREIRERNTNGLPYRNYTQLPLAYTEVDPGFRTTG